MRAPVTIRRLFLWLHMLTGLVFSIYAVLLGGSGAILVFREELTEWQYPQFHDPPPTAVRTTPDQALRAVRSAYPEWTAYSLTWPNLTTPYWMSYIGRAGKSQEAFVNTESGEVVGARGTSEGLVGWLTQAHFNLLLGSRTGRTVQGFGVFALLAMCVSGLWLWWPVGGARFASRFRVDWRGGWRKIFFRLHHVTGIGGLAFIAMWAVTGGYYIWLNPYLATVDKFFTRSVTPRIEKRPADTAMLPMAELARRAQAEFPERPLYRMSTPSAPDQAISVTLLEDTPAQFHRMSTVVLDPVSGAVLQKGASVDRPAGNAILGWISVLHFGRFGGSAVRLIWFLMGLTIPLLAVTGCFMWWRRVIEPQLRRRREVEVAEVLI
jgi:uncharacterized iron-regulated membrane protein